LKEQKIKSVFEKFKSHLVGIFIPREVVEEICDECGVLESFRASEDLWSKLEEARNLFDDNLLFEVGKIFSALKPFSYKKITVPIEEQGVKKALVIGSSIYVGDYTEIVYLGRRYAPQEKRLAKYIIKYADEVRPYVRRSIREDFSELAELARELRTPPPHVEISRKGDFRIWNLEQTTAYRCSEILLTSYSSSPLFALILKRGEEICGHLYPIDFKYPTCYILTLIEHYGVLYEMLKEYYSKLSKVIENNNKILRKMKEIAAPYFLPRII